MASFYKRSKGNAGLDGVQFQVGLSTVFLLNAFRNLKGWRISTENEVAGKFDDLVIEFSDGSALLLQAKHKDNKRINRDQLLSDNSRNADFSLPKYFLSYQAIKSHFNVKNIIICTNADVDKKKLKDILEPHCVSLNCILYHEEVTCSYVKFNENILPQLKKNSETYYDKNFQGKGVDRATITDDNLKDFLDKLQLFSGYPSKIKLDKVINKLLTNGTDSKLWIGTSSQEIYEKVEDWFKDGSGEYLDETLANTMFCEIRSNKYRNTLRDYNVSFTCIDISFMEGKQIFHINAERGYLLQVLKIYYALQEKQTLYVNPNDDVEVHKPMLEAFSTSNYEFLVLVLTKKSNQRSVSEINMKLKDKFNTNSYKKIVIICSKEHIQQISQNDILELDETVNWKTLTDQCRERLLSKKTVAFQGVNVSLGELLPTSEVEDYDKAANSEVLENLVKDEKIRVGKRPSGLDQNTARYYVNRKFEREIEETEEDILVSGLRRKETVTEADIFEVTEKAILISDGAGMGKTTVLTKLGTDMKENNPLNWILRIELNDYSRILMDTMRKRKDTITLNELLNSNVATKLTNELEEYLISMPRRVVLMLDGFDEISPHYTELILNLIRKCYTSPNFVKIIVSTRPDTSRYLEEVLQVKPFLLQPFTREDQIAFLTSYWAHHLELDHANMDRCEKYAVALINKMSSWINARNNFAAIPLQVRMLAEIFQENFKRNNSTEWEGCKEFLYGDEEVPVLPERMKILKLFDMFIDKKFDIFLEKANPSGTAGINSLFTSNFKMYFENHQSIALKIVLGNEAFENETIIQLFSRFRYDKSIEAETLKIGVIQENNGEIEFVHRTFAEYFAAKSIIDITELQDLDFNKDVNFQIFFIDGILCNRRFVVIHTFLESVLEDIVDSLPANAFEHYQRLATGNPDSKTRRSQLVHLLAQEGCLSILRLILKCINYSITTADKIESHNTLALLQNVIEKDGINIKDELGNTPLHYASREGHLNTVRYLVEESNEQGTIFNDLPVVVNHKAVVNLVGSQGFTALHLAARQGHYGIVRFLEERGADINIRNIEDYTPLHSAATGGNMEVVKFLVERGVDADLCNDKGFTALNLASLRGHLDIVKYLADSGANINIKENNGFTALLSAAIRQNLDVVKLLQGLGLDINEKNDKGLNVLLLTVIEGNLSRVKSLVACGCDVNASEKEGLTALHLAAETDRLDIVKFLVENNANVNITSNDRSTPLHSASQRGHLEVVKFLIENGAWVNATDNTDYTPLHAASGLLEHDKDNFDESTVQVISEKSHLDTVKFLVQCGAQVNKRDDNGFTPLYMAAQSGHLDVLKFLVEQGADAGVTIIDGFTALHAASVTGHLDIVRFLVEHNINVNVCNHQGITPLNSAARFGHLEVTKFLFGHGANVNSCDVGGFTPLHLAARWGHLNVVRFLIDHGADFCALNLNSLTALHLACINGQLNTVKLFVEQNLLPANTRNKYGVTILHSAAQYGHLDIVEFLVKSGAHVGAKHYGGITALYLAAKEGHLHVVECLVRCGVDVNERRDDGFTALHVAAQMGRLDVVKCLVSLGARVATRNKGGFIALHMAAQAGHLEVVKYILEASV